MRSTKRSCGARTEPRRQPLRPVRVTQAFLPLLTGTRGAIVNVVSVAASSLSQTLRALLAGRGVSVHATMLFVSRAPLETLQTYKRRMGWSFPWVSSANREFNVDLGFSSSEEQTREAIAPMHEAGMPPIVDRNASETGTDPVGYREPRLQRLRPERRAVYHTYSTTARGVEFLMGYYPILDRASKGRDEGDAFQLWIRRHDEYDSQ